MGWTNDQDVAKAKSSDDTTNKKTESEERKNKDNNLHEEVMYDKQAIHEEKIHDKDLELEKNKIASHDHEVELKNAVDLKALDQINQHSQEAKGQFQQLMQPNTSYKTPMVGFK